MGHRGTRGESVRDGIAVNVELAGALRYYYSTLPKMPPTWHAIVISKLDGGDGRDA